jgi:uncharacterized protein YecE (DUF72 family)
MQDDLFGDPPASSPPPSPPPAAAKPRRTGLQAVAPAEIQRAHVDLAAALPALARLGTSSWSYPGWKTLVWAGEVSETLLSRHGLSAYSQHPLLRTVSVDRSFYQPLTNAQYAAYAAQVPEDFRFIVKAPASVCDAMVRDDKGRAQRHNPVFLDAEIADNEFIRPALQGLRHKVGALVFQLSPLPPEWLHQPDRLLRRLSDMLRALSSLRPTAPEGVMAVEVRDHALLTPDFAAMLKEAGTTYCMGLHAKMPPIERQLPLLRSLWPGPLVCRWNLHRRHGAYGYEDARALYAPFDHIQDADLETRDMLAKVIAGTVKAGLPAYVSISNKAEGCAPLSVEALAQAVVTRMRAEQEGPGAPSSAPLERPADPPSTT